jgi:hypothetical protein
MVFKPTEEISKVDVSNWKRGIYKISEFTSEGNVLSQKTIILR